MLRGLAEMMENHHNVRILDEAVVRGGAACRTVTSPAASFPTRR